jgi:hypothetical protein
MIQKTFEVRMLLNYYKDIQLMNLPLSLAAGIFGSIEGVFLKTFIVSFLSVGFLTSVYFFGQRKAGQYFFYYNKGFSKSKLVISTYLLNVIVVILLLIAILVYK